MQKKLYHYDAKTGEYLKSSLAQVDAKSSKHSTKYFIPPYSTLEEPPKVLQSYRVAVFDFEYNSWKIVEDYRGQKAINKTTKEITTWTEIGPLPRTMTFVEYDPDLKDYITWSDEKIDWVIDDDGRTRLLNDIWELRKTIRNRKCNEDVIYGGHAVHVDPVSLNDLLLAAQEALLANDMVTTKRWITSDATNVQYNGNDFVEIVRLFGERRQRLVYQSNEDWINDNNASTESLIEIYKSLKKEV